MGNELQTSLKSAEILGSYCCSSLFYCCFTFLLLFLTFLLLFLTFLPLFSTFLLLIFSVLFPRSHSTPFAAGKLHGSKDKSALLFARGLPLYSITSRASNTGLPCHSASRDTFKINPSSLPLPPPPPSSYINPS